MYIRFWDANTGELLNSITQDTFYKKVFQRRDIYLSWVEHISLSPDGTILASALDNNSYRYGGYAGNDVNSTAIRLWDVSTGDLLFTLSGHANGVLSIAFSPDGKTLASASRDRTIRLWDVSTGDHIRTLTGHTEGVWNVLFSRDGETLISSSWDRSVRLWDANTGRAIRTLTGRSYVSLSPDGQIFVGYDDDNGGWQLWDASTGSRIRPLTGAGGGSSNVTFSPDGKMFATAEGNSTVHFREVSTGRTIHTLTGPVGDVTGDVAFSPDGQKLASGYGDGTVHVWDLPTTRVSMTPAAGVSPAVGDAIDCQRQYRRR